MARTGKEIYNRELPGRLARRRGDEPSVIYITYGQDLAELIERAGEPNVMALGDAGNVEALAADLKRADLDGVYSIIMEEPEPVDEKTEETEAREKREEQGLEELVNALRAARIDVSGLERYPGYLYRGEDETAVIDALKKDLEYWEKSAWEAVAEKCEAWKKQLRERRAGGKKGREDFDAALARESTNTPQGTGFKNLDEILDGGLYPGLYVIGALSALGKTTFALQAADYIAASTDTDGNPKTPRDVLIFSLEMSKTELEAKSISRLTAIRAGDSIDNREYMKTTRGILRGDVRYTEGWKRDVETRFVEDAKDAYFNEVTGIGNHIYIREGIGDIGIDEIRRAVRWHTKAMGTPPVVIVDYLQILAPYNERWTDKQNTDKSILELKRLSRDLDTPVIAISSFNRDAYNEDASMKSFKESGAIEYGSDVLIALDRTTADKSEREGEDAGGKRKITARILKNRNGRTRDAFFVFDTKFNRFIESEAPDPTDSTYKKTGKMKPL